MKIDKKKLFKIIDSLKEEIDVNLGDEIRIDKEDFYWQISNEELYNPIEEPSELTLGQLSDDWSELLRLYDNNEIAISYDLKRLSVVFGLLYSKSRGKW
ncbi:hypothetical protein [Tenacibaculum aiptasiae]|uniref:hypothetical protein n=1 Tax=Tenacibaculum aiptasiae TaxID=426481 RepID=UPI00232AF9B4|nr:hypothetical protein [Tenacibaculum aiptasiae]